MNTKSMLEIYHGRLLSSYCISVLLTFLTCVSSVSAQTPPGTWEVLKYSGLFEAVVERDAAALKKHIRTAKDIDNRDDHGRTALHVAAYTANHEAMRLLVEAGADPNALEHDHYDIITIAAVANDIESLRLGLKLGASPGNITSPGAPLDHVNNLKWTALIESIVLGDGEARHTATLKALVDAGAKVNLADGHGRTPLFLAMQNGYTNMITILTAAGAK